jgi:hypothetical protein
MHGLWMRAHNFSRPQQHLLLALRSTLPITPSILLLTAWERVRANQTTKCRERDARVRETL